MVLTPLSYKIQNARDCCSVGSDSMGPECMVQVKYGVMLLVVFTVFVHLHVHCAWTILGDVTWAVTKIQAYYHGLSLS